MNALKPRARSRLGETMEWWLKGREKYMKEWSLDDVLVYFFHVPVIVARECVWKPTPKVDFSYDYMDLYLAAWETVAETPYFHVIGYTLAGLAGGYLIGRGRSWLFFTILIWSLGMVHDGWLLFSKELAMANLAFDLGVWVLDGPKAMTWRSPPFLHHAFLYIVQMAFYWAAFRLSVFFAVTWLCVFLTKLCFYWLD